MFREGMIGFKFFQKKAGKPGRTMEINDLRRDFPGMSAGEFFIFFRRKKAQKIAKKLQKWGFALFRQEALLFLRSPFSFAYSVSFLLLRFFITRVSRRRAREKRNKVDLLAWA